MLGMNLIIGGLSAIVAPKLGQLSDRYGRRKLMALASCGGLVSEVVTILCAKYPQVFNYRFMLVGAMFDGITGSFTAGSILSQSYTSDCTPPSRRAVSIGYVHACLFTGLALGPLLAGYFVKWTGAIISIFYVALGCHLFFIIFVRFIMPESLSKRRQRLARTKHEAAQILLPSRFAHNPFTVFKVLWPTGPGTSSRLRINLVALAIADTIIMGSMMAVGNVLMLYSEFEFGWGNFETSRFISALSMVRVAVLMVVFPIINYVFRIRPAAKRQRESGAPVVERNAGADSLDIWVLRFALASDVLGCVGYTLARNQQLFFASGMVTALGGLGSATVQAAVTKHVPASRVGQVLGAVGFLQAQSRVVGPVLFNGLYAMTVGTFPQAIFVLLCGLFGIGLICAFILKPHGMSPFPSSSCLLNDTCSDSISSFASSCSNEGNSPLGRSQRRRRSRSRSRPKPDPPRRQRRPTPLRRRRLELHLDPGEKKNPWFIMKCFSRAVALFFCRFGRRRSFFVGWRGRG